VPQQSSSGAEADGRRAGWYPLPAAAGRGQRQGGDREAHLPKLAAHAADRVRVSVPDHLLVSGPWSGFAFTVAEPHRSTHRMLA
jgi:hypothetical protein